MYTKYKICSELFKIITIFAGIEIDFLLAEKELLFSSPATLILFIIFLHKKNSPNLTFFYLASLPFSLIYNHSALLYFLFYTILWLLNTLFQNSILIKKTIPYFLAFAFLIMQKAYLYFVSSGSFFIKIYLKEMVLTNILLFLSLGLYNFFQKK